MLAKVGKSVIKNADRMEMIEKNSYIERSTKVSGLFAGLDHGKLPQDLNPIISMVYHSHIPGFARAVISRKYPNPHSL